MFDFVGAPHTTPVYLYPTNGQVIGSPPANVASSPPGTTTTTPPPTTTTTVTRDFVDHHRDDGHDHDDQDDAQAADHPVQSEVRLGLPGRRSGRSCR